MGKPWYGDGNVRLPAPLSPTLRLGPQKITAFSPRHNRDFDEADRPQVHGYPPPAQVMGVLFDAVFLDLIDQDALRMKKMNDVLGRVPVERRDGMRVVDLLVIRPSCDLGRIAAEYEPRLPRPFRLLTRGLGTRETAAPDVLSMLMFQDDFVKRLIAMGEEDGERRAEEIDAFMSSDGA